MTKVKIDSAGVQSYLEILQSVINRMATNSSASKTWCIGLVSAIVVVVADKGKPEFIWIAIFPIVLFLFLDSYYLSLEIRFRDRYNAFIKKLHNEEATIDDVFIVTPVKGFKNIAKSSLKAVASLSVWPFYLLLIIMLFVVRALIK
ncbi:MAG: hypothetical protein NWE98_02875 [Candidatus Bathyarchaeota archaeon]|nr:hypothetical protein [Candidatus Bathyarchaeota archaeon]